MSNQPTVQKSRGDWWKSICKTWDGNKIIWVICDVIFCSRKISKIQFVPNFLAWDNKHQPHCVNSIGASHKSLDKNTKHRHRRNVKSHHFTSFLFTSFHFYVYSNFFLQTQNWNSKSYRSEVSPKETLLDPTPEGVTLRCGVEQGMSINYHHHIIIIIIVRIILR